MLLEAVVNIARQLRDSESERDTEGEDDGNLFDVFPVADGMANPSLDDCMSLLINQSTHSSSMQATESDSDNEGDDTIDETSHTSLQSSFSLQTLKSAEIEQYFTTAQFKKPKKEELAEFKFAPVQRFWQKNKEKYPHLYIIAMQALSVPASTVYSERLFSEAGNIYEKKRSRLLPTRGAKMLFLHHNYPLLDTLPAPALPRSSSSSSGRSSAAIIPIED